MKLGDFLVAYLRKIGVPTFFGIPGDLALKLFFSLGRKHGFQVLTFSHEPGVGFAADGYARATAQDRGDVRDLRCGRSQHGQSGRGIVFGAGADADFFRRPRRGRAEARDTLIHHQAREIESQHRIFNEVTCASAVLTDPRRAAQDLHEVVRAIWTEQRPGYIEIHRDMVDREIEVPDEIIEWDGYLHFQPSDPRQVEEAARETAADVQREPQAGADRRHRDSSLQGLGGTGRAGGRIGAPV